MDQDALSQLAPSGTLRAGINLSNFLLVMAPGMPDLRPVGPELGLPGLGQAFALRHDVVDRVVNLRYSMMVFMAVMIFDRFPFLI